MLAASLERDRTLLAEGHCRLPPTAPPAWIVEPTPAALN
jgi:hypothetical protein